MSQLPRRKTSCKRTQAEPNAGGDLGPIVSLGRKGSKTGCCWPATRGTSSRSSTACLASSSQVGQFNISIRPADFVLASNHIIVGLQLRQSNGSSTDPSAAQVTAMGSATVGPVFAAPDLANRTQSLALVDLGTGDYRIDVRSDRGTSGAFSMTCFWSVTSMAIAPSPSRMARRSRACSGRRPAICRRDRVEARCESRRPDQLLRLLPVAQEPHRPDDRQSAGRGADGDARDPQPRPAPRHPGGRSGERLCFQVRRTPGPRSSSTPMGTATSARGTTTADAGGHYAFNVVLHAGPNTLQVQAGDGFGQRRSRSIQKIRLRTSVDTDPPVIAAGLINDTGRSNGALADLRPDHGRHRHRRQHDRPTPGRASMPRRPRASSMSWPISAQVAISCLDRARLDAISGGSLTQGPHVLHLLAEDQPEPLSVFDVSFVLDTIAPQSTITAPVPDVLVNHNVTVIGGALAGAGILSKVEASLDGGALTSTSSSTPTTGSASILLCPSTGPRMGSTRFRSGPSTPPATWAAPSASASRWIRSPPPPRASTCRLAPTPGPWATSRPRMPA